MDFHGIIYDQVEDFMQLKSTDDSEQRGTEAERAFIKAIKAQGYTYEYSDKYQDFTQHWDFAITKDGTTHKVEVKASKKRKRHDAETSNDIIYVEFKNINGSPGWLYGKADVVAFELSGSFIVVRLDTLQKLSETLVKDEWANTPTLYKKYKRTSRPKECVSLITLDDLKSIDHRILNK